MLEKIKGDFFLKYLCQHIKNRDHILRIFNYNKCLQQRLNISINDYKNKYYQTIIEIKPGETKKNIRENVFIRIVRNFYENYHIYFDNNKNEIKRNYLEYKEKVGKITIYIDYNVKSLKALFLYCNVEEIKFIKYKRKDITDMSLMFYGCHSLANLNVSNLNTENVKYMNLMFGNCKSLKYLDISNFNTEKTEKMNLIFQGCSSLEKLNLTNITTNNVNSMMGMFSFCSSLGKLDLSKFKTNKVTNMMGLLENCYSLKKLNLSNFKTDEVKNMSYMFSFCTSLEFLDISNFKSNKETNMKYMFNHCESLVNLNNSKAFNIYKENSKGIFTNCNEKLKEAIKNDKNLDESIFNADLVEFSFDHYRTELFNEEGKSEYIPFFLRLNSYYGAFNTYELINWKDPNKLKLL